MQGFAARCPWGFCLFQTYSGDRLRFNSCVIPVYNSCYEAVTLSPIEIYKVLGVLSLTEPRGNSICFNFYRILHDLAFSLKVIN